jgi:hypothetical protein
MNRDLSTFQLCRYGANLKTFGKVSALFLLATCAALFALPADAQTLNFTVETSTSNGTSIVPRLTWTTTPAGAVCNATTLPASTPPTLDPFHGSKPANGTNLLPAISATRSYTLNCNWPGQATATVTCTAPTQHTDGTPVTDLSGYRIDYGRTATTMTTAAYVTGACNWTSPTLAAGTWFFTARAVKANGLESEPFTPPVSLTLAAGGSQTRTLEVAVKFPQPPTGVTAQASATPTP